MTYVTHREFSISFIILGAIALYNSGVSELNYYIALWVMLHIGKAGALYPDVDHAWENVKEKTVTNFIINKIIHILGGVHRSWVTHSLDIALAFCIVSYIGPSWLLDNGYLNELNYEVLSIMTFGFCLGWLSHLLADMLTSEGIRLVFWSKLKIKFVPKKFLWLRFNTGHAWEGAVYRFCRVTNVIMGLIAIMYPLYFEGYFDKIQSSLVGYMGIIG